jgi:hypothetical protein
VTTLTTDTRALLGREVDDLLLDVRGLALVRDLLVERGATGEEIESHERALARARRRLAELLAGVAGPAGAVEPVEHGQVGVGELEIEDLRVRDDSLPAARLRNHHRSALYRPAQQHLGSCAA